MQHKHPHTMQYQIHNFCNCDPGGMGGWPGWGAYLHLQWWPPSGCHSQSSPSSIDHLQLPSSRIPFFVISDQPSPINPVSSLCLLFQLLPLPPQDITGAQPSMTVQQGKHTTVLEMEFCVLDFCLVTDSVYRSDYADPESVLVLLTNDLVRRNDSSPCQLFHQVAIDCKSTGLPSHENPYAMDFQVHHPPSPS